MECKNTSEVGKIKSILIKHVDSSFIDQANLESQWKELNYTACPDFKIAQEEYEAFVSILNESIENIEFLPSDDRTCIDSIYVRDSVIISSRGAILCNMGKAKRRGEPESTAAFLDILGIPIIGKISNKGRLEGGDVVWFDDHTVVVGRSYRTNDEGIEQFREITKDFVEDIVVVPLPHWDGVEDVFHLMSIISPVDEDAVIVYSRLLPIPFREWLLERGMKLIEVAEEEFQSMACNILALTPGRCMMLAGNPLTKEKMEREGIEVLEFKGDEISMKGAGGPTCLTRPLFRE